MEERSCREAFDGLTQCYSVGGQFRSYYRFGEFSGCSEQLERLWSCMRNRNKNQDALATKTKNSLPLSNAVWEERSKLVGEQPSR